MAASTRCAINVAGLERTEVRRGSMLGKPGQWAPGDLLLVEVRRARYVEEALTNRGAYHLHLGSGSWPVTLRMVEETEGDGAALVRLAQPVPVVAGDRFILRETGRRAVVGGGRVLDPAPNPRRSKVLASLGPLRSALTAGPDAIATALLDARGTEELERLSSHSGGGTPSGAVVVKGRALAANRAATITARARDMVRTFHEQNPLRPGIQKASLASRIGIDADFLEALVAGSGDLRDDGATVAAAGFRAGIDPEQERVWGAVQGRLEASGLAVPRIKELDLDLDLLHALLREGRLVRVGTELAYLPSQLESLVDRVRAMPAPFTVAEFRDHFELSRKYAVPLLEWLDARGVTERDGDVRTVQAG